jgi:drug/metabolite transporter (DMT)-like permease
MELGLDTVTVIVMLCAAALHASWHALVKSAGDQLTVLAGMGLVAATVALAALPFVALPPPSIWPILAISIVLHSGYRFSLAQAYARGDLSAAYPLARGLVPIVATAISVWALGEFPSAAHLLGIIIISVGVTWLASEAVRKVQGKLLLAVAGAGLTVAGYSVLDAYAARASASWLSFTTWLIALDSGIFFLVLWVLRGNRLWTELAAMRDRTIMSGLLGVVSFAIFIWALSRSPVGAVTALRETSVLFATLIGIIIYREARAMHRIVASVIITLGISLNANASQRMTRIVRLEQKRQYPACELLVRRYQTCSGHDTSTQACCHLPKCPGNNFA